MSRERKYDKEQQNHFAKTHQKVMRGHYMTDIDSLQIYNTENQVYQQYTYHLDSVPIIRRFIEVKSRMSNHLHDMFTGEIKPTEQVRAQAYFVAENNQFRKTVNYPKCEYYFVVMDFDNYPYNIYNVTTTFGTGEVVFNKLGTANNDMEYAQYFNSSPG